MPRLRMRAAAVSLALLLLQVAAITSPIAACCKEERDAAAVMDCCRGGDNGHICQMKKKTGETGCRLRSGCDSDPAGLLAAAGWIGSVPNRVEFAVVLTTSAVPAFVPDAVPTWFQLPLTPPPRG
jgi:hypothetical protein